MKFVCRRCEAFMRFKKAEEPARGSLGLTFECPGCGARFAMVTNAGETHLVQALGVQLGGRSAPPRPFELTRGAMREGGPAEPAAGLAEIVEQSQGKCPFANMMASGAPAEAGLSSGPAPRAAAPAPEPREDAPRWTESAAKRLQNVPDFVRPAAKLMIERLAIESGRAVVDDALMDEAKTRFM